MTRRTWRTAVLVLTWVVVPATTALAWWLAADTNASGQCSGLGFGCTLTPRDGILLLAWFALPPTLLTGTLAALVPDVWAALRRPTRRAPVRSR